jgi:hypothetical protein
MPFGLYSSRPGQLPRAPVALPCGCSPRYSALCVCLQVPGARRHPPVLASEATGSKNKQGLVSTFGSPLDQVPA